VMVGLLSTYRHNAIDVAEGRFNRDDQDGRGPGRCPQARPGRGWQMSGGQDRPVVSAVPRPSAPCGPQTPTIGGDHGVWCAGVVVACPRVIGTGTHTCESAGPWPPAPMASP
jgi:hypothetical protein